MNSTSKPLVSVIIPNYNHAKFLDERIQSVLNQTYQNFELIILDDKSTDDSMEVINHYKDNPHVSQIIVNEVNSGSSFRQWHKGLEVAKGELIWIAESDDSCSPMFLETVIEPFFKNDQCVLSFSRSLRINKQGCFSDVYCTQKQMCSPFYMAGKTFVCQYLKKQNIVVNASSAVFRRNIISAINKDYMNYKGCGDWLFWTYLSECGSVSYTPLLLNYFRFHSDNTTTQKDLDGTNDKEILKIYNYMLNNEYYGKAEFLAIKTSRYVWRKNELPFSSYEEKKQFMAEWNLSGLILIIGRLMICALTIKHYYKQFFANK